MSIVACTIEIVWFLLTLLSNCTTVSLLFGFPCDVRCWMFSVFAGRHYFDWIKLSPTCFHQVSRTFQGVVYKRPLSLISSGGLHPQKVSVLGCLKSLIEDSGGNFKKAVCKFQSCSYHHHHHPLYYSKRFGQGLVEDYSILMVKTDITIHHSMH